MPAPCSSSGDHAGVYRLEHDSTSSDNRNPEYRWEAFGGAPDTSADHRPPVVQFCIIGAMKGGTTSLYDALAAHPDIHMPVKETHWFSTGFEQVSIEEYERGFDPAPGQLCGEASTSYTMRPFRMGVPERLQAYNPSMKLIYIVRNPVDRIESHLAHRVLQRFPDMDPFGINVVGRSRYRYQIDPYLQNFPADQILIISLEQIRADAASTLHRVNAFLGVPFQDLTAFPHRNATTAEIGVVPARTARMLAALPVPVRAKLRPIFQHRRQFTAANPRPVLSPAQRTELWRLLIGDVVRFAELAPEVVSGWMDDPAFPRDAVAQEHAGAEYLLTLCPQGSPESGADRPA